ncbi:Filament-like plant protein 4 [Camellia lanceoleosa]|uniref:Filament-like plant protein 4 n=1 Tax=Camellia lanceoleosa TaxID=1840588 RepID=A0ACC0GVY4_9ERIC|nr:Filament-like plant protein 4 [Camellia lanceoleosa]
MEDIMGHRVICAIYRVPDAHKHITRPPAGVIFPEKVLSLHVLCLSLTFLLSVKIREIELWINDFQIDDVSHPGSDQPSLIQGTSPDGDVLSPIIQKFSAAFDNVINSKISLLDFVLDLSCVLIKANELHFNVLGYKNNEAETNCSYCIDKVALPENKVVRDISGERYSNGCAHFSDSSSDPDIPHEGNFISTFESNATSWKCSLEEFEQLKLEKYYMVLDLESTKAQLQRT